MNIEPLRSIDLTRGFLNHGETELRETTEKM